jgi:hypothetical protein
MELEINMLREISQAKRQISHFYPFMESRLNNIIKHDCKKGGCGSGRKEWERRRQQGEHGQNTIYTIL